MELIHGIDVLGCLGFALRDSLVELPGQQRAHLIVGEPRQQVADLLLCELIGQLLERSLLLAAGHARQRKRSRRRRRGAQEH